MPFKLTKTSSDILPWGRSVSFNTTSYISTPANAVFNPGNTGAWTLECWFYPLATTAGRIALLGNGGAFGHALQISWGIDTVSKFSFAQANGSSATVWGGPSASTYALNTWYHLAVSKDASNNIKCFINGVEEVPLRQTAMTSTIASGNSLLVNSKNDNTGKGNGTSGYTSNVRWIKGTALYTASFTPPTSPLDVIANTSLLACHDTSFKDGSVNNFTITTSGTPSISTATPFVVSTKSVLFNGSTQYLTIGAASNWSFLSNGSTTFTAEAWIYPTGTLSTPGKTIIGTSINSSTSGISFYTGELNAGDLTLKITNSTAGSYVVYVTGAGVIVANTWQHVAVTLTPSGSNPTAAIVKFYVNGVLTSNTLTTGTISTYPSAPSNTLHIAACPNPSVVGSFFTGYISNARIVNGTALYTSSFTALSEPLTSIASCSLLTCNAPTIIDSSTNNFTITNNGSATVSSVVPFNVVGYGYKFNNRNNTAINKFNFKQAARAAVSGTQKAIFGYGYTTGDVSMTNLVSNTGVVATDTTGVGTSRRSLAAAGYGSDKSIFGYGYNGSFLSMTNLVSNTGVVSSNTTGVGTDRSDLAAAGYGSDKAIFGYGYSNADTAITNKVSNTGVVATDTTGVGTARDALAAAGYGSDKAIFGYGQTSVALSMTNLVSNTGVVSNDTTGVGTARTQLAAASYGTDKAIFGYGYTTVAVSLTNLVSNTGVVATDTTGVGTGRYALAAAGYGSDKAIFGYGQTSVVLSMTNLVSNTGVVSNDTTGVGTARRGPAAASYSLT